MSLIKFSPSTFLLCSLMTLWATPCGAMQAEALSVKISVKSHKLLLRPGKLVPVDITIVDSRGKGVENIHVQLASNVGKFRGFEDMGQGKYVSQWTMPEKKYPQVAILAAKIPGVPPSFTILRLRSATNLPTKTNKPRVSVTMDIGGRKYGPVKSDDNGNVIIPVQVGPGETEALASAIDEFGNKRTRKIKIPQPRYSRLVGFAECSSLEADGISFCPIYLISALVSGRPNSSLKIVAYRRQGKLSPSKRLLPGLYTLRYIAPAIKNKKKAIPLTLADKADPKKSRVKFIFNLNASTPAKMELSFDPAQLVTNGRTSSNVVLVVKDRGGNPIEGFIPQLRCDKGVAEPVIEIGGGSYQSRYTPPAGGTGKAACHAILKPKSKNTITAQGQITLLAPVPTSMDLILSKNHLPMDGASSSRLDIKIMDSKGEPLNGADIKLRVAKGTVDTASPDGNGSYHATYIAPRGKMSTKVRIFVTVGQGRQSITKNVVVELEGLAPPPPPAPWITLGPSGAFLTNFALMMSGGFTVNLGVQFPGLGGFVYLNLESGYRHGVSHSTANTDERVETVLGISPLLLSVLVKPFPRFIVTPLVGLGGGAQFVQWSISTQNSATERQHKVLLAAFTMVGCEVKWGPGALVLAVKYLYAFLQDEAPLGTNDATQGSKIKGNAGGLDVSLGYQLHF